MKLISLLTTFLFFVFPSALQKSIDETKSAITIYGTSTLHDWEMQVTDFTSTADIGSEPLNINSLVFSANVDGLKSSKKEMDKNAYEALNKDDYPSIYYQLVEATLLKQTANKHSFKTKGILTIAGTSKPIEILVEAMANTKDIQFSGEVSFDMSEWGVTPPTLMFGTLKTGDEVRLEFDVTYK